MNNGDAESVRERLEAMAAADVRAALEYAVGEVIRLKRVEQGLHEAQRGGVEFMRRKLDGIDDPTKLAEAIAVITQFEINDGARQGS